MRNLIFTLGVVTLFFACNESGKKVATEQQDSIKKDTTKVVNNIELKDRNKTEIFTGYIALKDALVKTDSKQTAEAANKLQPMLANSKGCEDAAMLTDKIAKSDNIETQRTDFTKLSTDLIAFFKTADLTSGTIYVQHCPMANKGDGGDWLSKNKEVRNPYYGDKMLTCGSVVDEIKTK